MPLLADYAITPDVFDVMSYSSEEVCGLHVEMIREVLLTEGLVRDLRAGEWRKVFSTDERAWHRRAKELLRKLATQGRMVPCGPVLTGRPSDDRGWCAEALATHAPVPFTGGVIVTEPVKKAYTREPLVARIDRLSSARWWAARSSSVSLSRNLADYRRHLDPVFRCANSILFIDPHLDPARHSYREFGDLVAGAGGRTPAPTIEIHRVCYEGSGPARRCPLEEDSQYFDRRFRAALERTIRAAHLRVEVFVWDDFHDRFLISNLIGISLPNGLDTTSDPHRITRWTRLGRADGDDIQREFDRASGRHTLRHSFVIE